MGGGWAQGRAVKKRQGKPGARCEPVVASVTFCWVCHRCCCVLPREKDMGSHPHLSVFICFCVGVSGHGVAGRMDAFKCIRGNDLSFISSLRCQSLQPSQMPALAASSAPGGAYSQE